MGITLKDKVENISLSDEDQVDKKPHTNGHSNGLSLTDFHKHYEVVFLDESGHLNITSKMNKSTFLRAKREAKLSIKQLNNKINDCFQSMFIHDHTLEDSFDALVW
jgi:hypothetical protein